MAVYLGTQQVDMKGGTPIINTGIDTSDATANAADILKNKTAYVNGEKITGSMPDFGFNGVTNAIQDFTAISENDDGSKSMMLGGMTTNSNTCYIEPTQPVAVLLDETDEKTSMFGNATASDVVAGKTFTSKNNLASTGTHVCPSPTLQSKSVTPSESSQTVTPDSGYDGLSQVTVGAISNTYVGSGITKKSATTYTPSTSNQTIASGTYLSGTQTIKGDSNLVSGNIKSGVSIFGVSGSYTGSSSGSGNNNCEAYHITSTSAKLSFKNSGTVKVYGYGYKTSTYTGTMYTFVGNGYYTSAMYGTPSKTNATFSVSSSGTLSGLPSGLTTVDLLVEIGV